MYWQVPSYHCVTLLGVVYQLSSVNINRYSTRERLGFKSFPFYEFCINELSCGSTVYESIYSQWWCCISWLNLQRKSCTLTNICRSYANIRVISSKWRNRGILEHGRVVFCLDSWDRTSEQCIACSFYHTCFQNRGFICQMGHAFHRWPA